MTKFRWAAALTATLLTSIGLIDCASEPKRAYVEPEWYGRMHKLSEAHRSLMPMVINGKKFADPREQVEIERSFKLLVETSAEVARDPKAPDADPLIAFEAKNFATEMQQAYNAYHTGDYQWSRFALSHSGDYCIACHTRADRGTRDYPLAWKPQLAAFTAAQMVEYNLANRQYAKALGDVRQMLSQPSEVARDPQSWMSTLKKVMTMLVRVEGDAKTAENLTVLALQNKDTPFFVRSDLREWLKDIRAWSKEAKLKTDKDKLREATRLLEKSQSLAFRKNAGAFIASLRASKLLHEMLEHSNAANYDQALFLSGSASESLGEINLAQYYFESCITRFPHTLQAERCYAQLENNVHEANPYLNIDPDQSYTLRMKLADLRHLAEEVERDDHHNPRLDMIEDEDQKGK